MNWLLFAFLLTSLQARAAAPMAEAPAAELSVEAPISGSASTNLKMEGVTSADQSEGDAPQETQVKASEDHDNSNSLSKAAQLKNLKEADIPVQLDATKKSDAQDSPLFRVLFSIAIIGILAAAAFYWLRKYRFSNDAKSQATQIKVLTQHFLGPKKSLAIIRVAGESVLIGVTEHNISMIKSLSLLDEEIPEETPKEFKTVFSVKAKENSNDEAPESRDDFSISGIKDFVSVKLKNMRSLE